MAGKSFSELPLSHGMLKNIRSLNFHSMTGIQEAAIPTLLQGRDVIAQAKTGSGKTVAFGISLLSRLKKQGNRTKVMVLCPTRELAEQVSDEIRKLARHIPNTKVLTLCGGRPIFSQLKSLDYGAHIVVGTPGRIKDHLNRGSLIPSNIDILVLDEADRMLDMGFHDEIQEIVEKIPENRQTLLFSATFPEKIETISSKFQKTPKRIEAKTKELPPRIDQIFIDCGREDKAEMLANAIQHFEVNRAIIFCQTKVLCDELAQYLFDQGYFVDAIHGDVEQRIRDEALTLFMNGSIHFLIATDVAARGLDIKDLPATINFDLARDPEVHVHRIGRTGRAGKEGLAISLVDRKDRNKLAAIKSYMDLSEIDFEDIQAVDFDKEIHTPEFSTIRVEAGKKNKIRPGDILGLLTSDGKLKAADIGNIKIYPFHSYVAVKRNIVGQADHLFQKNTLKGKQVRARVIR